MDGHRTAHVLHAPRAERRRWVVRGLQGLAVVLVSAGLAVVTSSSAQADDTPPPPESSLVHGLIGVTTGVSDLAGQIVQPIATDLVEPLLTHVVTPVTQPVVDSVLEPVVHDVVAPVTQPVVDAVTPIVTDVVVPVTEPIVSGVVEPVVSGVVDPLVTTVVVPVLDTVVSGVVAPVLDPVVSGVVAPVLGTLDPVLTPVVEVLDPVVTPVVDPLQPLLPGGNPGTGPATEPGANPEGASPDRPNEPETDRTGSAVPDGATADDSTTVVIVPTATASSIGTVLAPITSSHQRAAVKATDITGPIEVQATASATTPRGAGTPAPSTPAPAAPGAASSTASAPTRVPWGDDAWLGDLDHHRALAVWIPATSTTPRHQLLAADVAVAPD